MLTRWPIALLAALIAYALVAWVPKAGGGETAAISWIMPAHYEDGTPIEPHDKPLGSIVHWGTDTNALEHTLDVGAATNCVISNLLVNVRIYVAGEVYGRITEAHSALCKPASWIKVKRYAAWQRVVIATQGTGVEVIEDGGGQ